MRMAVLVRDTHGALGIGHTLTSMLLIESTQEGQ